ncbi:MAG: GtrA family protein [Clostridiales bacterium]|nr:GtrA family protein [Clostridiales bacterium]
MKEKIRKLMENRQLMEVVRYLIAGVLTTIISTVISFGVQFALANKPPMDAFDGVARWIIACIEAASPEQVVIANAVSWVFAVLFAFFINRGMVFRVRGGKGFFRELGEFTLGRVLSFVLFEQGLAWLLAKIGVSNIVNRILIQVVVIVFNYVVSKFWVFRKKTEPGLEAAAAEAQPPEEERPSTDP